MLSFQYHLPTRIVFGSGTLEKLPNLLDENFPGLDRILLVTGRAALRKQGFIDRTLKLLEKKTVLLFDKVEANPTSDMVYEGMDQYKKHGCQLIVGIGGGSVLDAAKAMATLLANPGTLESYQRGDKPKQEPVPFVALPTTSGTSSEMSMWSVITNLEGEYKHKKKSFSSSAMYPRLAIIDPELTLSLPPDQTASTGLDALCHAIEGAWSKKRNPLSDAYALQAISRIVRWLPKAHADGSDKEAREQMSFAVLLAGLAFTNSRTTSPHKVSYPLTTLYNLPHGAACAVTLPSFMEYIGEHEPARLDEIVAALGQKDWKESVAFLKSFIASLGMPAKLGDIDVDDSALALIAKQSFVEEAQQEDPVPIPYDAFVAILKRAL